MNFRNPNPKAHVAFAVALALGLAGLASAGEAPARAGRAAPAAQAPGVDDLHGQSQAVVQPATRAHQALAPVDVTPVRILEGIEKLRGRPAWPAVAGHRGAGLAGTG